SPYSRRPLWGSVRRVPGDAEEGEARRALWPLPQRILLVRRLLDQLPGNRLPPPHVVHHRGRKVPEEPVQGAEGLDVSRAWRPGDWRASLLAEEWKAERLQHGDRRPPPSLGQWARSRG